MKKLRKSEIKGIDLHYHWWGLTPIYSKHLYPFCVCLEAENGFIVKASAPTSNMAYKLLDSIIWKHRRETGLSPQVSVKYFS